jgi:hypothetical protein
MNVGVVSTNMRQTPGLNTNTDSSAELAAVVDDLLNQLNTKFTTISSDLLSKSKSGNIISEPRAHYMRSGRHVAPSGQS